MVYTEGTWMMKSDTIQIHYATAERKEMRDVVVVARYGTLVVHRSQGTTPGKGEAKGWSITHAVSGYRVHRTPIATQLFAKKLAKHLSQALDWTQVPSSGKAPDAFLRELLTIIKEWQVM